MTEYNQTFQADSTQGEYTYRVDKRQISSSSARKNPIDPIQILNHNFGAVYVIGPWSPSEFHQQNTSWYNNQLSELESLKNLQTNWDSYGAEAPNHNAIYWARETLDLMHEKGIFQGTLVPSAEGGLAISFRSGNKYSDIEFLNSGDILAVIHKSNKPPKVWEVSWNKDDIEQSLEEISSFLRE